jgi:hypothetical protein
MATGQDATRVPLSVLSPGHFAAVKHAMSNLLGSTAALDTYAQVANGIPVPRVPRSGEEDDDPWWLEENPDPEPSQEAHEFAKTIRDGFCVETAEIDAQV